MKSRPLKLQKELQVWADWLMYVEFDNLFEATIKEIKSMGEELDGPAARRLEFYHFKSLLLKCRRSSSNDHLADLLKEFDNLEIQWGEESNSIGIETYQWFCIRRMIFRRMAIEILKTSLSIDDINIYISTSPDRLVIPSNFDYSAYKLAILQLYSDFKDDLLTRPAYAEASFIVEELQMDALRFTRDLLIDSSSTSSSSSQKVQLSAAKIVGVIRDNNVSHFIQDICDFLEEVVKVLPIPAFTYEYVTWEENERRLKDASSSADVEITPDWSEEKKLAEGPYKNAITAANSLQKGAAVQPNSSQQSNANNASAYLVGSSPSRVSNNKKKAGLDHGSDGDDRGSKTSHDNRRRSIQELKRSSHPSEAGGSIVDEHDEVNTQPQSIDPDATNTNNQASRKKRRYSTGTTAHKVTTIDEDERQEALVRGSGDEVEDVDDDSEDERTKAIGKVINLNQKSLASATVVQVVPSSMRRISLDGADKYSSKKRKKWSPDEEIALIEALDKYYKGQWSQMKSDPQFSDRLKDRTSVNLKDKYRDLVKHGKVPHIVENDDEEG